MSEPQVIDDMCRAINLLTEVRRGKRVIRMIVEMLDRETIQMAEYRKEAVLTLLRAAFHNDKGGKALRDLLRKVVA